MVGQATRVYYRIAKGVVPAMADFTSNAAKGLPLRRNASPDLWAGLSMYDTAAQAREVARRFPALGSHVAAVAIEDGAPIRVAKTLGPGHYTLWGEPQDLFGRIVEVVPV